MDASASKKKLEMVAQQISSQQHYRYILNMHLYQIRVLLHLSYIL